MPGSSIAGAIPPGASHSKCPQCGSTHFEIVNSQPDNSRTVLRFVQCRFCHCVLGALDFYDLGYRLQLQDVVLRRIAAALKVSADELD